MPRSASPRLTIRTKSRKETTNRSQAKYSRAAIADITARSERRRKSSDETGSTSRPRSRNEEQSRSSRTSGFGSSSDRRSDSSRSSTSSRGAADRASRRTSARSNDTRSNSAESSGYAARIGNRGANRSSRWTENADRAPRAKADQLGDVRASRGKARDGEKDERSRFASKSSNRSDGGYATGKRSGGSSYSAARKRGESFGGDSEERRSYSRPRRGDSTSGRSSAVEITSTVNRKKDSFDNRTSRTYESQKFTGKRREYNDERTSQVFPQKESGSGVTNRVKKSQGTSRDAASVKFDTPSSRSDAASSRSDAASSRTDAATQRQGMGRRAGKRVFGSRNDSFVSGSGGTGSRDKVGDSRSSGRGTRDAQKDTRGMARELDRVPKEHRLDRIRPTRVGSAHAGAEVEHTSDLRLNKFLADAGIASRRSADELIEAGVVKVNGVVVTERGTKVHPADLVTVRGEPVSYVKHLTYLVLNKPKDYITTTSDEKGRKTVMDLIPLKQRLYPVGRLDRNTTGALIITNDGELATRLMHPKYEIEREYVVGIDKKLSSEHAKTMANGVQLEDGTTGPAEILINPDDKTEVRIILCEGKNREVRRLFEHFGYEVLRLHRVRYAHVTVSGLSRGEYRHLSRDEVRALRRRVKIDDTNG